MGGNFVVDLGCGSSHVEASGKGFAKVLIDINGLIILELDDKEETHFLEGVDSSTKALAEDVVINSGVMLKSVSRVLLSCVRSIHHSVSNSGELIQCNLARKSEM
ncbi:hypothetical protein QYF36_002773 [Acer negundo]|nr:hypothetical protein QYF36_002773 [Acer negundo]